MSDQTVDAEIVPAEPGRRDSSRKSGAPRRRDPSLRKLKAAALYASGTVPSVGRAIVAAGYAPSTARNPREKSLGSVELVRVDATYNPAPVKPREMYEDGLATLHGLALKGESESVRGGSADRLVNHLKELVTSEGTGASGLHEAGLYTGELLDFALLVARATDRLPRGRAVELLRERRGLLPPRDKIAEAMRPRSVQAALDDALGIHKGINEARPGRPFWSLRRGLLRIPEPRSEPTTFPMARARAREIPTKDRED